MAVNPVNERFRFTSRFNQIKDNAVAFEMITDDVAQTTKKV